MDHHVGLRITLRVAIAREVIAAVDEEDRQVGDFRQLPGQDRAGEPRSNDQDTILSAHEEDGSATRHTGHAPKTRSSSIHGIFATLCPRRFAVSTSGAVEALLRGQPWAKT